MAIYPTKTNKLNMKNRKNRWGISLITIFSILLVMLIFNFIEILNIAIIGTFGLSIYPISILMITFGIMILCGKKIKTTKTVLILSFVWFAVLLLILQLATSQNIDNGFSAYIETTFKSCSTAGGVLFATLLYPLYILTYSLATYIILAVILVVLTAILIDKIHHEIKNSIENSVQNKEDVYVSEKQVDINNYEDEEMAFSSYEEKQSSNEEDDIFIEDEIESEQREEAKSILGLRKSFETTQEQVDKTSYIERLEKEYKENQEELFDNKKPNIFVHDDSFDTPISLSTKKEIKPAAPTKDEIEEEKRKAALAYLNISKGKFEAKKTEKGIDNVASNKPNNVWQNETPTQNSNLDRLSSLRDRFNNIDNTRQTPVMGKNPFKDYNFDIYDESLTKESFKTNQDKFSRDNSNFNNTISNMPKRASEVYSGITNENIVETTSFRPVQESMIEPVAKKQPQQKVYKRPPTYIKPPIDLLTRYSSSIDDDSEYMREKGNLIVETLKNFKIETKIINAIKGPTFTRYELQMAPGISVNTINSKINDLSMVLESTCRVQVPIPGKNAFGIEVPNKKRVVVGLREIIESSNFQNSKSPLTFALGKDISADCKVAQIDKLVHTLVAGTTGSGKSICLNTMLISLLYKTSPEDLRLILVDPKQVEFTLFNNLPHMLIPNTITECDKAVSALGWLVEEMDRRYKKLSNLRVKNIGEYNESPEVVSGSVPKMFYIVMIFDEVGDFMVRAKKEIEEKVLLLAAKSRACGIHLILATQRPTTDVITGTIKANLPSRIAFAVSSAIDSKVILESTGAESLLGRGDMLFLPQGSNDADRIQGCLIETKEVNAVINFINDNNEAVFDEEIEDQMFNKKDGFDPSSNGVEDAFDPMLKDCLRYFIKAKKASASSLQGYFGIGYPKANKIVLQMERAGFVSAGDHNGRRTLFITQQEFEERFGEDLDE